MEVQTRIPPTHLMDRYDVYHAGHYLYLPEIDESYTHTVLDPFVWNLRQTFGETRLRVLDAASGVGKAAEVLSLYDVETVLLDVSENALGKAYEENRTVGLLQDIPFTDGAFHGVHIKDGISHAEDLDAFFKEMRRLVTPNGMLALATANAPGVRPFFHHGQGNRQQVVLIESMKDYIKKASQMLKVPGAKVGSPHFYHTRDQIIEAAATNGFPHQMEATWVSNPTKTLDWYMRDTERFVFFLS
jgi:ubiquinone/menaquinone biosynthesis C-methylase UbiE